MVRPRSTTRRTSQYPNPKTPRIDPIRVMVSCKRKKHSAKYATKDDMHTRRKMSALRRRACILSAFLRSPSGENIGRSVPASFQRILRSSGKSSQNISASSMKLADQHNLNPMDLAPDIHHGQSRYLRNRFRVQIFQIRQNHLAVGRIEPLDQREQTRQRLATVRGGFDVFATGLNLGLFQSQKGRYIPFTFGLPNDVRRRRVMRNTVDPGSKRAPSIELPQAAPQRQMDLLREVAPQVRIGFVGIGHPGESRAILLRDPLVKFVLAFDTIHLGSTLPHINPFSALFEGDAYAISWLRASSASFCHYNRRPDRIGSAPPEVSTPDGPSEHAVGAAQHSASAGPTLLRVGEC